MQEVVSRNKHKSISFDLSQRNLPSDLSRLKMSSAKEADYVYKNAFALKKRPASDRGRSSEKSTRPLPSSEIILSDANFELKQLINTQNSEILQLKTQLQYSQSELSRILKESSSYTDLNHLTRMLNSQKNTIKDLKEEIKKKDSKIDEVKKMSKFCQITELEAEISYLTEQCKTLLKSFEAVTNNQTHELKTQHQEDDIQKSILITQLKKEKERFLESIEEKNQEIIKWRTRVIELENAEAKQKSKIKKKNKEKMGMLNREIKDLKMQLDSSKKSNKELQEKYEAKIESLKLKVITERHSPKNKPTIDAGLLIKPVKGLRPVPLILELINEKISKTGSTIDSFFHQVTLLYSNYPTVKDFQVLLEIQDSLNFCIDEIASFFSAQKTLPVILFKEFCNKAKFTPPDIQAILQNITIRLQLQKVPRDQVNKFFLTKKAELKNPNSYISLLCGPPFDLEKQQANSLINFLFPQGLSSLSSSHITMALSVRLGNWTICSEESEKLYKCILSKAVEDHLEEILNNCKLIANQQNGVVVPDELLSVLRKCGVNFDENFEQFLHLEMYRLSKELDRIKYIDFLNYFNTISEEGDPEKIRSYYLKKISNELHKRNLPVSEVFKEKKGEISGTSFIEGLTALDLATINEVHLNLLLESLQSSSSINLSINSAKLKESLDIYTKPNE